MKTSIIMTSYNYANFITQAIESVMSQTVQDWELIIVDDGSTDNSREIIEQFCNQDERIKLFTHKNNENKGLKNSILLGLEKAQYEWIAFLESDDFLEKNYLEEKYSFILKYPTCNFIYNNVECFGNEKKIQKLEPYFKNLQKIWSENEIQNLFNEFGTENVVPTFSCVMCKKNVIKNCDLNPVCEPIFDYWLWWQISENNDFGFINKKLTNWRIHGESYLAESAQKFSYLYKRSLFISEITKLFNSQCKLSKQNKTEQNTLFAIIIYTWVYIRRATKQTLKRIIYKILKKA